MKYDLTCYANDTYAPSRFQLEEYCKGRGGRYTMCPFFKSIDQAKKIFVPVKG
jgi:hypothetical protein